jgi:hypothetical protein
VGDHRSAALLIRVWLEDTGEFRARLLAQQDDPTGTSPEAVTVAVVSSPDGVLDAVRNWLGGVTQQTPDLGK